MMVKKKKKYSAKTKSRMLVIFMFFGIIIFTLSYTLLCNLREIGGLVSEINDLEKEYLFLLDEEAAIEADIKRLEDPEYIARYAREKYLYSKDGEIILRIK